VWGRVLVGRVNEEGEGEGIWWMDFIDEIEQRNLVIA
jgi:hypothetical protein